MTKINYQFVKRHELGDEYELITGETVFRTNIDGYPYLVLNSYYGVLNKKDKFSIDGEQGMYTVTHIDLDNNYLEAKIDKVLDLTERRVDKMVNYYTGWGLQKEADKVKANYMWEYASAWTNVELCIEGKLSKNQVVQYNYKIIKITELIKSENGLINIIGDNIDRMLVQPVFPYKENGEIICWYDNYQDVLVRGAREFSKKYEKGEVKLNG